MNTYDNTTAPNALDYLGNYLKKEDVGQPQVVTVIDIYEDELPGESRKKLIAKFEQFTKPMVLNTTNIKRFVKMFGTTSEFSATRKLARSFPVKRGTTPRHGRKVDCQDLTTHPVVGWAFA